MTELLQRSKRVPLHLAVEVRGEEASGAAFHESTRSLNISGGGLLFELRHTVLVGARLAVEIDLPLALRKHFGGEAVYRARAVVCRVEHLEGQPLARVGARFLDRGGA